MNPKAVIFDVGGVLVESPFLAVISWAEDWDIPFDLLIKIFGQYSQSASHDQSRPFGMMSNVDGWRSPNL